MALSKIEIKILRMLRIAHDDINHTGYIDVYRISGKLYNNDINDACGTDAPKIAKQLNSEAVRTVTKYLNSLDDNKYIEIPSGSMVKITPKGIDCLDDLNNNKKWSMKWIMEHFWFPLLVALIAGYVLL